MGVLLGLDAPVRSATILHAHGNIKLGRAIPQACRQLTRFAWFATIITVIAARLSESPQEPVAGSMLCTELRGTGRDCRLQLPVLQQSKVASLEAAA